MLSSRLIDDSKVRRHASMPHDQARSAWTRRRAARWVGLLLVPVTVLVASCKTTGAVVPPPAVHGPSPHFPSSAGSRRSDGSCGSKISACCAIRIRPLPPSSARDGHVAAVLAPATPLRPRPSARGSDARVRARAALAIGRVGLTDGVEPLSRTPEGRGRRRAADVGVCTRVDSVIPVRVPRCSRRWPTPRRSCQGRAAEALGLIGERGDATAVAGMVRSVVGRDVLSAVRPDDLTYPQRPKWRAPGSGSTRSCRLGSYEALASAVLDERGQRCRAGGRSRTRCNGSPIPAPTPRCCRS
jgi:hypothetical protein